jgi:phospholipid transport system substrate-binding protein
MLGEAAVRMNTALVVPLFVATVTLGAAPAAAPLKPLDLVKSSVSRVTSIVEEQRAAPNPARRRAQIRAVADELFDFKEMARLALASHWADRSPPERTEFVRLFTELLEQSYITTIENYAGERIVYLSEHFNGPYARVRSKIVTNRRSEISIEYRLSQTEARWAVYDVLLDGASLVSNYRSQFNSIIRTESFASLMDRMRKKEIDIHAIPRRARGLL